MSNSGKKMKRASMNSNSQLDDEEAMASFKFRSLEQDFVALQKEFISNKRKLLAAQRKKETLLAEVKFLRQRHRCLSETQSREPEDPELQEFPCSSSKMSKEGKNHGGRETFLKLIPDTNHTLAVAVEDDKCGKQKGIQRPPRPVKKPKNGMMADKKGKKKISWQDQVATRVEFSETEL